jgi:uncharacterized protein
MPHRDAAPIGAPCWIDLMTTDTDRTRAFYGELFGWTSEAAGEEFGGYISFSLDGVQVAGGMGSDGQMGPTNVWNVYLATADAAATVAAAEAKGGEIAVPPMAVGDLGTMAFVSDPGQAAIGVWQPGLHAGFGIFAEHNSPSWFELHTRAYDASVDFYRTVFAWDTHVVSDEPDFRYTTLGEGEGQLAGIMDGSAYLPEGVPAQWSIYFGVDDTDKALARITDLGGAVTEPAQDTPYGRLAAATDSTGARFKLVSNS